MKSIEELERFLEEESYSFIELSIGNHFAPQGIVIKQEGNEYIFGYSERGTLNAIKSFRTEKEIKDAERIREHRMKTENPSAPTKVQGGFWLY